MPVRRRPYHLSTASTGTRLLLPQVGFSKDFLRLFSELECTGLSLAQSRLAGEDFLSWYQNLDSLSDTLTLLLIQTDSRLDFTPMYALAKLRELDLQHVQPAQHQSLTVGAFPNLEWLAVDGLEVPVDFEASTSLTAYRSYRGAERSADDVAVLPGSVRHLEIVDNRKLPSVEGLQRLQNLRDLTLAYLPRVRDTEPLSSLSGLSALTIEKCGRPLDLSPLCDLDNLLDLTVDSSEIVSLRFVRELRNLAGLTVRGSVQDRDLRPILEAVHLQDLVLDLSPRKEYDFSVLPNGSW